MQGYVKAIVNQCIKVIVMHSKYQCPPGKVGDCSQFWFNFLTDKIVRSEKYKILFTHILKMFIAKKLILPL